MSKFSIKLAVASLLILLHPIVNAVCDETHMQPTTPIDQFTGNGDGTVTDKKTGLMWKKCSEGQANIDCSSGSIQTYTWRAALEVVQTVNNDNFAGYSDWRLPNIKELASIVEERCKPAIDPVVFPWVYTPSNVYIYLYWTASPFLVNGSQAWYVSFDDGHGYVANKNLRFHVRLVR